LRLIKIGPENPAPALAEAAAVLKSGGIVAYPTESFYALGADALNPDAVAKVFEAKGRGAEKALPVIIHDKALIGEYIRDISPIAEKAVHRLMPGPVTLLFWAKDLFPTELTGGTGKIAIRVPEHPVAAGLARAFGGPVTATSANLSGLPGLTVAGSVADAFGDKIDLVLDSGPTSGPPTSTLVDVTAETPVILREGRLGKSAVESALGTVKP